MRLFILVTSVFDKNDRNHISSQCDGIRAGRGRKESGHMFAKRHAGLKAVEKHELRNGISVIYVCQLSASC